MTPSTPVFDQILAESVQRTGRQVPGPARGGPVPDAKTPMAMAGRFINVLQKIPGGRGLAGFGFGLMRGDDPIRAGADALYVVNPKLGLGVSTVLGRDNSVATADADYARKRGFRMQPTQQELDDFYAAKEQGLYR